MWACEEIWPSQLKKFLEICPDGVFLANLAQAPQRTMEGCFTVIASNAGGENATIDGLQGTSTLEDLHSRIWAELSKVFFDILVKVPLDMSILLHRWTQNILIQLDMVPTSIPQPGLPEGLLIV